MACRLSSSKKWYRENRAKKLAYQKKYAQENREKIAAYQKIYAQENPELSKQLKLNYVTANPEKRLANAKRYRDENRKQIYANETENTAELTDVYVGKVLNQGKNRSISLKDIPPELIELKRVQLQITRELRGRKNEKYS